MTRTRLAVVFGGRSSEHAISCVSAGSILAALDRERYDVVAVGITPQGRWVLAPDDPAQLALSGRELPAVKDGQAVALPGDPTAGGLVPLEDGPGLLGAVDVVFPVLHGPYGEDGTLQGLLELADVPYVGSGVLASAAAMDKTVARTLLAAAGLPVTPALMVRAAQWHADEHGTSRRAAELGLPLYVKPARGGSSIGISRVETADELSTAVERALRYDTKLLIEAAVVGREIECGVLDDEQGRSQVSVPGEIRVAAGEGLYDFDAKYLDGTTQLDVPADLPDDVSRRLQAMALTAYEALDCAGLARVDFFVGPDGALTVNELNTMPGFTPTSMYPRLWAASGVDYPQLVDRLVQSALRRGTGLR